MLFLIAGFPSHMLFRRLGSRGFLQERTTRLLLALIAAMILIVPLAATISGCWLFYRLGDLFPAVPPLIGLKRRPPAPSPGQILPSPSAPAA